MSTTNWEKGRIIFQWRAALVAADTQAAEYADEAWSRRVGGVSPQHVGRLRRVHERFAAARGQFPGLFWSHFQAALDWDDAEMWLEGAVQSRWSVADMRRRRSETLGTVAEQESLPGSSADSPDEDFSPESSAAATDPGWTTAVDAPPPTDSDDARGSSRHDENESAEFDDEADDDNEPQAGETVATAPPRPSAWPTCRTTWLKRLKPLNWPSSATAWPAGPTSPKATCSIPSIGCGSWRCKRREHPPWRSVVGE